MTNILYLVIHIHLSVCVHIHVHVYVYICVHVEAIGQPWEMPPSFVETGCLTDLGLTH